MVWIGGDDEWDIDEGIGGRSVEDWARNRDALYRASSIAS